MIAALFGEQAGQVDQPSDLLRGNLHGPPQMRFGIGEFLALFGQLGLRPISFGGIDSRDLGRGSRRLVEAAAQEAGSLQVILEEIALSI